MTDRQVSGTDVRFLDAVRDGLVPAPGLMDWNAWQRWRRTTGQRPTVARDGELPGNRAEVALWRQAMEAIHGARWLEELHSPIPAAQAGEPRPHGPDAAAAGDVEEIAPASPTARVSPGSGGGPARSPGSGERTPPQRSWHSSNPGTPTSLMKTVMVSNYDPSQEPIDEFVNRLHRQSAALETLGQPQIGRASCRERV